MAYIQSGFAAGRIDGPYGLRGSAEEKRKWTAFFSQELSGSEVFITDLSKPEYRLDVRTLSETFRRNSRTSGKPFYGYYVTPGILFRDEVSSYPDSFMPRSLRSDGLPVRRGDSLNSWGSFQGDIIDTSNPDAVSAFLKKVSFDFRSTCYPESDCVGPLFGFYEYNENALHAGYSPFPDSKPADTTNLEHWPIHWEEKDLLKRYEPVRGGHPVVQWFDGDIDNSWLVGVKRAIPLFSRAAAESFRRYAASAGALANKDYSRMNKLPADRNEFNDDESDFNGEPRIKTRPGDPLGPDGWVQFVSLDDSEYWQVWEDWVYQTWFNFAEGIARTIAQAQADNPDFHGTIYFQHPVWYSIRQRAKSPVYYAWKDADGKYYQGAEVLANGRQYRGRNSVNTGIDAEMIAKSPWFAGMVHETTCTLGGSLQPRDDEYEFERLANESESFKSIFLAKGSALKEIMHSGGKIFGAFARTDRFDYRAQLTPEAFGTWTFGHLLDLLTPDLVAILPAGDQVLFSQQEITNFGVGPSEPNSSYLAPVWKDRWQKLSEAYRLPPRRRSVIR